MLVTARMVQRAGAALVAPAALSLITTDLSKGPAALAPSACAAPEAPAPAAVKRASKKELPKCPRS
jgi:hypothetical protein